MDRMHVCPMREGKGVTGRIVNVRRRVDDASLVRAEIHDGPCGTCAGAGLVTSLHHAALTRPRPRKGV